MKNNSEWISIKDARPPIEKNVLVYCLIKDNKLSGITHVDFKDIRIGCLNEFNEWEIEKTHFSQLLNINELINVTYWMPLPKAPYEYGPLKGMSLSYWAMLGNLESFTTQMKHILKKD